MFIPVDPTNKTKIAFIPESMHLTYSASYLAPYPIANRANINTDVPIWQIAAYWQEIKQGKPITVFGVATIYFTAYDISDPTFNTLFPNRKHEDITCAELLYVTTMRDIGKVGVAKLGHTRPYFRPEAYMGTFLESNMNALDFYDAQKLTNLHANPTVLPSGVEGWYKINPKGN